MMSIYQCLGELRKRNPSPSIDRKHRRGYVLQRRIAGRGRRFRRVGRAALAFKNAGQVGHRQARHQRDRKLDPVVLMEVQLRKETVQREGINTRGVPKGKFPLAISFTLADGRDIADAILPHGSRGWLRGYLK